MRWPLVLMLSLAACAPTAHTADWYADHPAEIAAALDRCAVNGDAKSVCAAAADGARVVQQRRLDALRKTF